VAKKSRKMKSKKELEREINFSQGRRIHYSQGGRVG